MKLDEQRVNDLLRSLVHTEEVEWNCEECLASVAAYAECELAGKTPDEAFDKVRQHLTICADCQEEYRALLKAIREITSSNLA